MTIKDLKQFLRTMEEALDENVEIVLVGQNPDYTSYKTPLTRSMFGYDENEKRICIWTGMMKKPKRCI